MVNSLFELHAIVKGRVQGVGFRYTTKQYARQLGLTGSVRNLPDGNVEIFAQGSQEALKKLITNLKEEAFPDEITSIEENYSVPKHKFESFFVL